MPPTLALPTRRSTPAGRTVAAPPASVNTARRPTVAVAPARRGRPRAIAWRDTSLPGIGLLRAWGWLPTVVVAACAVALAYLVQTSGLATAGYDIQRLKAERSDWILRNEQLRLEIAKYRSLTWVEAEAVGRLGMQRPERTTFIRATGEPVTPKQER